MIRAYKIVFRIKYWPKHVKLYEKVKLQKYPLNQTSIKSKDQPIKIKSNKKQLK